MQPIYNSTISIFDLLLQSNLTDIDWSALNITLNITADDGGDKSFFDTYFSVPRFGVESSLAVLSTTINVLALISSANARNKRFGIYHTLFINLCVANILSCALSWLSNNIFFLFEDTISLLIITGSLCKVSVMLGAF